MATVSFTEHLRTLVECPNREVDAATVAEALDAVFTEFPTLRSYVVDERGALLEHIIVFIDGVLVDDRIALSDKIKPTSSLSVMQARPSE